MIERTPEAREERRATRTSRRSFLRTSLAWGLSLAGLEGLGSSSDPGAPHRRGASLPGSGAALAADPPDPLLVASPEARYWTGTLGGSDCGSCHTSTLVALGRPDGHEEKLVRCLLCAQACELLPSTRGRCNARVNVGGQLRSLVYGRPLTMHVDPIEKAPFYHFLPGRRTLTLATAGCPLSCKFCQNWEISQARPEERNAPYTEPGRIVEVCGARDLPVVTFTYNEPTVFVEYLTDIARAGRRDGIRSAAVSCGVMTADPLQEMCETLDAIKIDLKGFSEDFYQRVCGAELAPVLRSIRQVAKSSAHLEIVNLVVPTLNDSDRLLRELADWVMGEVGPDVPLHFSRFSPAFQLQNLAPTPIATLERARDLAMSRGLRYVYVGNAPGHPGNSTYCASCGEVVIRRNGFFVQEIRLADGICRACGGEVPGRWS